MNLIDPAEFADALTRAETDLNIGDIDADVLRLIQAHVDAEFDTVLKAENGDASGAACAFMLRGAYATALIP